MTKLRTLEYVGLIDKLLPSRRAAAYVMAATPLSSPWSTTSLTRVALADMLGVRTGAVTRADAMKIPAVVRGRGLICGTLSRYPLTLWRPNPADPTGDSDEQLATPAWLASTKTGMSPLTRMLWTLDDLIFSGMSLWALARDENGQITDALRVEPGEWHVDPDTRGVIVRGTPVTDPRSVCLIEGPQEGLVDLADDAVRGSRALSAAWQQRVESPVPLIMLEQTDENDELDDDEIDELITDWEDARKLGGTAFTPHGIKASVMGDVKTDLYVEGRNADRLDWGNYLQLPAAMLDGSMATATLTYSTSEGKRSEFVDYSLSYWASAVEARLSLDDMTGPGTYVRFDIRWLTNPTQPGRNPGSED